MIQRGCSLGFLHEAALGLGVGRRLRSQHLHSHEAVQTGVTGLINDAHSAFTELLEDLVVEQRPAQHRVHVITASNHGDPAAAKAQHIAGAVPYDTNRSGQRPSACSPV